MIGLPKANADQALKANHLTGVFNDVDSDKPAGTVVDADPKPGSTVKQNSSVTVSISRGNRKTVPSVVGRTAADARAALIGAGFTKVTEVPQDTTDATQVGRVINQDPDGNTTADPAKTTVSIFIGRLTTPPKPPPTTSSPTPTPTPTTP
jgi:serine/threonine-protein kinase